MQNRLEKFISELGNAIAEELCEDFSQLGDPSACCGGCPYHDKCEFKDNALARKIKNVITEFIDKEDEE